MLQHCAKMRTIAVVLCVACGHVAMTMVTPQSCTWHVPDVAEPTKLSQIVWAGNGKAAAIGSISKADQQKIRNEVRGGPNTTSPDAFMGEHCRADAYGEITAKGASTVLNHPLVALHARDTFFDLGAGFGRLTITAASQHHVKRSVGVELSDERFQRSCKMLADLRKDFSEGSSSASEVEMQCASLLDVDLSSASVVYIANLCFPPKLQNATRDKLVNDLSIGTRLAALQPFFGKSQGAGTQKKYLHLAGIITAEMTWDTEARVFVYQVEDGSIVKTNPLPEDPENWGKQMSTPPMAKSSQVKASNVEAEHLSSKDAKTVPKPVNGEADFPGGMWHAVDPHSPESSSQGLRGVSAHKL